MRQPLAILALALASAACSPEPEATGAITPDEERQLNEAAEMLDANSISPATLNAD